MVIWCDSKRLRHLSSFELLRQLWSTIDDDDKRILNSVEMQCHALPNIVLPHGKRMWR